MKKQLFILVIIVFSFTGYAQDDKPEFLERTYVGGGLGLGFGDITNIQVSPLMGFNVTEAFSFGLRLDYQYLSADYYYYTTHYSYNTSIYGGGPFVRLTVYENFYITSELEMLSLETRYFDVLGQHSTDRFVYIGTFVGAGMIMPAGKRSATYVAVLYNLNDSSNSPYSNPLVMRGGFYIYLK